MRGQISKELITRVILTIFPNSFIDGKDIRIPAMEDGEEVQIKLALTASKTNVAHENGVAKPSEIPADAANVIPIGPLTDEQKKKIIETLAGIIDVDLEPIEVINNN